MNILVMGGSAFNGRARVPALVRAGHNVTVCNRGRTPIDHPPGVATIVADRTDADATRAALAGTSWDAVIDMTAYHPNDVQLMIDVFEGAVGHYIFVSSTVIYSAVSAANPGPISELHPVERVGAQFEYGLHKILCEDLLLEAYTNHGFPATTVCLGMSFGPHNALPTREQRMFARMLGGRKILLPGDGSAKTVVGYVEDQAEAFVALCGVEASFGKRFNLTGDDPHSNRRYINTFAEVLGVTPEVVEIPAELMDKLWAKEHARTPMGGTRSTMDIRPTEAAREAVTPHLHKIPLASLTQRLQPSIHDWNADCVFAVDAIKEMTGWSPAHTFDTAVADAYEWWKSTDLADTTEHDWRFEDEILELL